MCKHLRLEFDETAESDASDLKSQDSEASLECEVTRGICEVCEVSEGGCADAEGLLLL